ncbi:MAG: aminoacyl-tRNA deacylase [Anaerolineales bacterium]|nr:aminoacyl-tRNA deacylase [Anaerolineales bacterium]
MVKNNVTRLLESHGIAYQAFELPKEKLSGMEAASYLGVDPERVYKTIVVTRQTRGKPILALVPAPSEVDLKSLSQVLGEKKVHLATQRDAERITGLQTGGISPLALVNRGFQVVIDISAQPLDEIYISGGQRGINIRLAAADLVELTNAEMAAISR